MVAFELIIESYHSEVLLNSQTLQQCAFDDYNYLSSVTILTKREFGIENPLFSNVLVASTSWLLLWLYKQSNPVNRSPEDMKRIVFECDLIHIFLKEINWYCFLLLSFFSQDGSTWGRLWKNMLKLDQMRLYVNYFLIWWFLNFYGKLIFWILVKLSRTRMRQVNIQLQSMKQKEELNDKNIKRITEKDHLPWNQYTNIR